jgi:hypothetical protein
VWYFCLGVGVLGGTEGLFTLAPTALHRWLQHHPEASLADNNSAAPVLRARAGKPPASPKKQAVRARRVKGEGWLGNHSAGGLSRTMAQGMEGGDELVVVDGWWGLQRQTLQGGCRTADWSEIQQCVVT